MEKYFEFIKKTWIILLVVFILFIIFLLPAFALMIGLGSVPVDGVNDGIAQFKNLKIGLTEPFKIFQIMFRPVTGGEVYAQKISGVYFSGIPVIAVICLVSYIWFMIKLSVKSEWDKIEHGSARWSLKGEQYKILSKTSGILLAKENYLPVDKPGNVNVMVIGGSGSGKSASFVVPNANSLLGSYVFTDPKGELYDLTSDHFRKQGYDIKVLNLVTHKYSDGFNPLQNIEDDTDLDIVSNTIVRGQTTGGSDPFWEDNAETLLKSLILFLKEVAPKKEMNLASCANLVRLASNTNNVNQLQILMNMLPSDHMARKHFNSISGNADKAYSSILSTLQSKLSKFESKSIAALTSTNTIEFEEIGKKKTALYVISSDSNATYDFLLTIFFSQMIQKLYESADKNGGKVDVPVYFFLDEFANIGQIPDFDKKISTSRSRKIAFNVILQNLDQLENIYPESYETILANCDTHLFLGSNSQKTAEYFSKALGEVTIHDESKSKSKQEGSESGGSSVSESINKFARPLMTPDELKRLDNNKCIIFEKGLHPVMADKYFFFKEKDTQSFQIRTDHNEYVVDRGEWREFDINRPEEKEKVKKEPELTMETSEKSKKPKKDLKDLEFDLDDEPTNYNDEKSEKKTKSKNATLSKENTLDAILNDVVIPKKSNNISDVKNSKKQNKEKKQNTTKKEKPKEKNDKQNNKMLNEIDLDNLVSKKFDDIFLDQDEMEKGN